MLERPFLMMLDKKDHNGILGWNSNQNTDAVLYPNLIDWRWNKPELIKLFPVEGIASLPNVSLLSCRAGYEFHTLCDGDQHKGTWDGVWPTLVAKQNTTVLYSEYSASMIAPFGRSVIYKNFISTRLVRNAPHLFFTQLRFGFPVLFRVNDTFLDKEIFPKMRELSNDYTKDYVAVHVRTGHLESGLNRASTLASDVVQFQACRNLDKVLHPTRKWLLLTDYVDLAIALQNSSYITLDLSYSLKTFHSGMGSAEDAGYAWYMTLRDWLLLVYSPGPNMLRSRMFSAYSFGERSVVLGGKSCSGSRAEQPLLRCGHEYFDAYCE